MRWTFALIIAALLMVLAHIERYEPVSTRTAGTIIVWDHWRHRACAAVIGRDEIICELPPPSPPPRGTFDDLIPRR